METNTYPPLDTPYSQNLPAVVEAHTHVVGDAAGAKPPNYTAISVFNLLCCCWVFGIIALIFSLQVDSAWNRGDRQAAETASIQAKRWNIAGVIFGISCAIVIVITIPASSLSGSSGDGDDDDDYYYY